MVGQPHRNFMKMASWSSVSEHLVNPIGMSDQLKWNNHLLLSIMSLSTNIIEITPLSFICVSNTTLIEIRQTQLIKKQEIHPVHSIRITDFILVARLIYLLDIYSDEVILNSTS